MDSAFRMAIRFGTSSPKTSVRKESKMVIKITEMVCKVVCGMATPQLTNSCTSASEKWSAAKALPKKPESVMAT